jgi:hypothetical protein
MPMIPQDIPPVYTDESDGIYYDDESWAEYLRQVDLIEYRHREYGEPLLPLAEWVQVQAVYYRGQETEAAALVAEKLQELADEIRHLDAATPGTYYDRRDAMLDARECR